MDLVGQYFTPSLLFSETNMLTRHGSDERPKLLGGATVAPRRKHLSFSWGLFLGLVRCQLQIGGAIAVQPSLSVTQETGG